MLRTGISSLAIVVLLSAPLAHAQASRTWVSGVGDDANPCSRTAPCKTFAGAISKTMAKGEINALDPGGFGSVTITKSITIDGGQALAGILSSGTNGIVVNTAAADTVVLRNLDIDGAGTGINGIRFIGAGHLHVDRVRVWNTTGFGIDFSPNLESSLLVTGSSIHTHAKAGIALTPVAPATATATIVHTTLEHNVSGIKVLGGGTAVVRDSALANNSSYGLFVNSASVAARVYADNVAFSGNDGTAVLVTGSQAQATVAESTISMNQNGIVASSGGQVLSFGSNRLVGNGANGSFTGSVVAQ